MWKWIKQLLGLDKKHEKDEETPESKPVFGDDMAYWPSPKKQVKKPTLLEISKRRHPTTRERKLPRKFVNRPGVKQSQVDLKKAGYREEAKLEEDEI